jgi:predicted nucleic acid-binding protein
VSHFYFDSSALVKRYLHESGSNWVRSIITPIARHVILTARITEIEIMSAVSRQERTGAIRPRTAEAIRHLLARHVQREYIVIELGRPLAQQAIALLTRHPLRAYDAVQLASALESNTRLIQTGLAQLTFVSADKRLLVAAIAEGLATVDPNSYP